MAIASARPTVSPAARILVKEVNWLGDLVMSLPALWAVRQTFPQAHLGVLVREELASFFSLLPWVDCVLSYRLRSRSRWLGSRWELVRNIQAGTWDVAVLFPRSFESALWMYLAKVPVRIGVIADARRWLLTHPIRVDMKHPGRHQSLGWLELVQKALGCGPPSESIPLVVPRTALPDSVAKEFPAGHPFLVFAPGAAYGPAKQWPVESWRRLARSVVSRGLGCVFVGTASERDLCDAIAQDLGRSAHVVAGATTLPELAQLLVHSRGYVGNDSGATHLAGLLGVPTVALFGSTNPVRTAPLGHRCQVLYDPPDCSPCLARTCRFGDNHCLRRISPEQVLEALAKLGSL
jgi:heptosyltransferase-2